MVDIEKYVKLCSEEKYLDAEEYRMQEAPKQLFKFIPFYNKGNPEVNKRNIETFEENKIWASTHFFLNDPFEFRSLYLDTDKILEAHCSVEQFQELWQYIVQGYIMTSFTVDQNIHPLNNMPMWAYYANNHQGVCVEYEVVNSSHLYQSIIPRREIKLLRLLVIMLI